MAPLSFSSSLLSSPLPRQRQHPHPGTEPKSKKSKPHPPDSIPFPRTVAAAAVSVSDNKRQRLWKEGEYPGMSVIPGSSKKTPLRNLKKKLDRKNNARAWVCTVTETLSDCILKKQWLQALQVFEMLRDQPFYQPKEGTDIKLLVLLGKSGQPERAH